MKEFQAAREKILQHLDKVVDSKAIDRQSDQTYQQLITYMRGGKCIRGSIAYLTYYALGGTDEEQILDLAVALEFFQAMVLILDDIIDEDDTRRGMPTMHRQLGQGKRGRDLALCIAPLATFEGFRLLAGMRPEIITTICELMKQTSYGEMLDITLKEYDQEKILQLYRMKTGKYTFSMPLVCAALLAKRDELILTLEELGEQLGVLFQLQDDLFEITSTDKVIGKSVKSDIKNDVMTYPRYLLYQSMDEKEREILADIYGREPTEKEVARIRELHVHHDINRQLQPLISELNMTIQEHTATLSKELQDQLQQLIHFCINRQR